MLLQFTCPETNKAVKFNEEVDGNNLAPMWTKKFSIKCPYCSDTHLFLFREAYVEMVLGRQDGATSKDT